MYGTLENKPAGGQQSSAADFNGQQQQQSNGDETANGASGKKKQIYSHCHVQSADQSSTPAGNVDKSARRRLIAASIICLVFMIVEVVGGVLSNSLAIATDAAHLLTDFASFMISLFAIWLSSRPATRKMSFGWYRAEVIGALLSVLMIWLVTGLIVYMAVERLMTGNFEIDSTVMVITASAGLLVNIIMALALNIDGHGHSHGFHSHGHGHGHHDHIHEHRHEEEAGDGCESNHLDASFNSLTPLNGVKSVVKSGASVTIQLSGSSTIATNKSQQELDKRNKKTKRQGTNSRGRGRSNINVRAAFIHVIGDFLQSLGVLIAALVVHFKPEYSIVDPICTFLFSIIVLVTTINIIRDAINVLMEGIPNGINFIEVKETLQELPCVIRLHNLRIWSLSLDKIAISTHLVIDGSRTPSEALKMAIDTLKSKYNFFEVTIQVEEYREDMRDCEHCQDEEVVVNVEDNNTVTGANNQ